MSKVKSPNQNGTKTRMRPALTPEARESQLISLAYDLVESRLLDGTATSQETTYFLKLASDKTKTKLMNEKLIEENKLLRAKTEAIQSEKKNEEFYAKVLSALKKYNGQGSEDDDQDEYDEY